MLIRPILGSDNMKTNSEIKDILKNLPEHRLPDGFRESVMDAVKKAAIFDALEYKSVPIKRSRYIFRYAGLIAAILVLGVIWISGTLRQSYGIDEYEIATPFAAVPEAAVEYDTGDWRAFNDAMPFLIPDEDLVFDDGSEVMLDTDLQLEDHNRSWLPTDFIIILVSIGVLFGIAAFLIHLKR